MQLFLFVLRVVFGVSEPDLTRGNPGSAVVDPASPFAAGGSMQHADRVAVRGWMGGRREGRRMEMGMVGWIHTAVVDPALPFATGAQIDGWTGRWRGVDGWPHGLIKGHKDRSVQLGRPRRMLPCPASPAVSREIDRQREDGWMDGWMDAGLREAFLQWPSSPGATRFSPVEREAVPPWRERPSANRLARLDPAFALASFRLGQLSPWPTWPAFALASFRLGQLGRFRLGQLSPWPTGPTEPKLPTSAGAVASAHAMALRALSGASVQRRCASAGRTFPFR
jgi:hypothetical protein